MQTSLSGDGESVYPWYTTKLFNTYIRRISCGSLTTVLLVVQSMCGAEYPQTSIVPTFLFYLLNICELLSARRIHELTSNSKVHPAI